MVRIYFEAIRSDRGCLSYTASRAIVLLAASVRATPTRILEAHRSDPAMLGRQLNRLVDETSKMQNGIGRHLEGAEKDSPRRIVLHDVYEIHHRVISLRMGVRNALDRKQTEPVFRRLFSVVRDAREDAPTFPEIEEVRPSIDKASAILEDISGYYGLHE